jgi:hypothetical protein
MRRFVYALALLCVLPAGRSFAAEPTIETVTEGLKNPFGLAVQPETGHVFVADSGALRVVRIVGGKVEAVVTGFSQDAFGADPRYEIGPLGLAFLDQETLVVGNGGQPAAEDALLIYKIPKAGEAPVTADKAKATLTLPSDAKGPGNYFGVTLSRAGLFVTGHGQAGGWVGRADVNGTKIENFRGFVVPQEVAAAALPVGITLSPRGEIVVGQRRAGNSPAESALTFYSARDGKAVATYSTGLRDIVALAYSPQGQLYALDFSSSDVGQGGLYQLVSAGAQAVKAKKIVSLEEPTALAFGRDGALYLTVIGGKLLKIAPGL